MSKHRRSSAPTALSEVGAPAFCSRRLSAGNDRRYDRSLSQGISQDDEESLPRALTHRPTALSEVGAPAFCSRRLSAGNDRRYDRSLSQGISQDDEESLPRALTHRVRTKLELPALLARHDAPLSSRGVSGYERLSSLTSATPRSPASRADSDTESLSSRTGERSRSYTVEAPTLQTAWSKSVWATSASTSACSTASSSPVSPRRALPPITPRTPRKSAANYTSTSSSGSAGIEPRRRASAPSAAAPSEPSSFEERPMVSRTRTLSAFEADEDPNLPTIWSRQNSGSSSISSKDSSGIGFREVKSCPEMCQFDEAELRTRNKDLRRKERPLRRMSSEEIDRKFAREIDSMVFEPQKTPKAEEKSLADATFAQLDEFYEKTIVKKTTPTWGSYLTGYQM
eukprot:gnl/TRDRNA2_/TRDRNA2_125605_c0_seq1.p1 gnl/TRDRNA2_/TRDRNA2_125605_c0~~gnl/TRDRNA2_/TRDRNA2_125605_c0_seq1.p1  ORF type:complete len:398 (+),score=27.03 gnl/TRDRNA2_/TRDRNA2_125605_c0_seq1:80-1273(+)